MVRIVKKWLKRIAVAVLVALGGEPRHGPEQGDDHQPEEESLEPSSPPDGDWLSHGAARR